MGKKRLKADHRADTRSGGWGGLPHCVTDSLAYRHLSFCARAVLIEIVREMNGYNNGEIGISQRQLSERLNTSNFKRIGRAIAELMEHGFVDVAVEGQWKERQARQYRLTFVNTGKPGSFRPATNDYRDWKTPRRGKSGVEPVSAEGIKSAEPVSAEAPIAAEPVSAGRNGKLPDSPSHPAEPVSSLIVCHTQSPNGGGSGWWGAGRAFSPAAAFLAMLIDGLAAETSDIIPFKKSGGCEECGGSFDPGCRGLPKRFCSEACRRRAEKKRARARKLASCGAEA